MVFTWLQRGNLILCSTSGCSFFGPGWRSLEILNPKLTCSVLAVVLRLSQTSTTGPLTRLCLFSARLGLHDSPTFVFLLLYLTQKLESTRAPRPTPPLPTPPPTSNQQSQWLPLQESRTSLLYRHRQSLLMSSSTRLCVRPQRSSALGSR